MSRGARRLVLLPAFVFLLANAGAFAAEEKPNFVVILADDLGYGDLGCYGNTANRTPHLDRLARDGVRFADFHSNGANCSPTRAALLTGLYQQRCGIEGPLGEGDRGLPQGTVTIAEKLRAAGYATALVGKWHLGYRPEHGPTRHGFDRFVGHLHGATDYVTRVDTYGRTDWWQSEKPLSETGHNTTLITGHAVRFVEQHRDRPFFLFVSHSAIHFPWMLPEDEPWRLPGKRNDGTVSKYGPHAGGPVQPVVRQMIEGLDASVGEIVAALRRLDLEKRTCVVFTSDNGGIVDVAGVPRNAENRISLNLPFRGQKHGLYEGGHRVPAIAWWPGRIAAGRVSSDLCATTDLMPTLLELAGIAPVPSDGISLADHLLAGNPLPERTLFWRNGLSKAVRWKSWKLVRIHDRPFELYDLDESPAERPAQNRIDARPEIRDDLLARLRRWEADVDARTK